MRLKEFDTPEKKAQRDALMKQYLAKGGKVQKVPTGQTAYKGKELKPAFKKDPALKSTPITSPMSDESKEQKPSDKQVRQAKGIAFDKRYKGGNYTGAHNTIEKLKKGLTKHPDVADALKRANEEMNRIIDEACKRHKTNEEAPFDGMSLVRMALMRKFITAEEWYHLKDKWKAATQELEQRYDDWPEDQGFGSSDHAYAIKELMELVGYEFDDQDTSGRFVVSKMPPELEKLGIKNARMKGEPVKEDGRAVGGALAILDYGTELAQAILKKAEPWRLEVKAKTYLDQVKRARSDLDNIYKYEKNRDFWLNYKDDDKDDDKDARIDRAIAKQKADAETNPNWGKDIGPVATEERQEGFAVRYSLDGVRKVQAYKTEQDAEHRAKILRSMGGVDDVSITKHTLNFKKESAYESKLVRMLNQRLK